MTLDVLVVDDDGDMRLTLVELLTDEGYVADSLADGRKLVETIEKRRPFVVLLDLSMPGFDVLRAAEELRERGLLHSTRVIVMSGRDRLDELVVRYGFHGMLGKPFDIAELLEAVGERPGDTEQPAPASLPP